MAPSAGAYMQWSSWHFSKGGFIGMAFLLSDYYMCLIWPSHKPFLTTSAFQHVCMYKEITHMWMLGILYLSMDYLSFILFSFVYTQTTVLSSLFCCCCFVQISRNLKLIWLPKKKHYEKEKKNICRNKTNTFLHFSLKLKVRTFKWNIFCCL